MALLTAERNVILISASVRERREELQGDAQRLLAKVDWMRLAGALRQRRLLPLLGPRIVELAGDRADASFVSSVELATEAARRQGAFIQLITLRITELLADVRIPSAPLKGPMLGEAIYGDPGRRLSSDIDLLVAPEQLDDAVEAVRGIGYEPPNDHVRHDGLPLLHFAMLHSRGDLPPVELHWRVHWHEQRFARERLLPRGLGARGGWRPERADELLSLLLFYARDGFIDLRAATDLAAWWDTFGPELAPGALAQRLREYPELVHLVCTAADVAEKTVGVPLVNALGRVSELGVRDRLAVRLANPHPESSTQSQLYAEKALVDGLLTSRRGLTAFIGRELFPPREVRDGQAQHAGRDRARTPVVRAAGLLIRYLWALRRLRRAPETLVFASARGRR